MSDINIVEHGSNEVRSFGIKVPDWINPSIEVADIGSIMADGNALGYTDKLYVQEVVDTVDKMGIEISNYIGEVDNEAVLTFTPKRESWIQFCEKVLASAVWLWANSIADTLEQRINEKEAL